MKKTYISHDVGARNDPKLVKAQMAMGEAALSYFWGIVEMLWENGGYLPYDIDMITYQLPKWADSEKVRQMLTQFDLFDNDGERFWSNSALRRISEADKKCAAASKAGKASAEARKPTDVEQPLNESATSVEQPLNERSTLTNLLTNLLTKQSIYIYPPTSPDGLERHTFFDIFFFKNFTNPSGEVERFIEHYNSTGWLTNSGNKIVNRASAARGWKPEAPGKRFNESALAWYKTVYAAAHKLCPNPTFLTQSVTDILRDGPKIIVRFKSREVAQAAATVAEACHLAGDNEVEYQVKK